MESLPIEFPLPIDPLTAAVVVLSALGALICLRVLAIHRQRYIEPHDLAREAHRLRAEYQRKLERARAGHNPDDEEIVV
jgi:hypothetical protein